MEKTGSARRCWPVCGEVCAGAEGRGSTRAGRLVSCSARRWSLSSLWLFMTQRCASLPARFPSVPSCSREGVFSACSWRRVTGEAALQAAPELRREPDTCTFRAQGLECLTYVSVPRCPSASPAVSSLAKDRSVSVNLHSLCGFEEVSAMEQGFPESCFLRGAESRDHLRG